MKTKHGASVESFDLTNSKDTVGKLQQLLVSIPLLSQNLEVSSNDISFARQLGTGDVSSLSTSNVHFEPKHISPIHILGDGDLSLVHFETKESLHKRSSYSTDESGKREPSPAETYNNTLLVSGTQDSKVVRRKSISNGSTVESLSSEPTIETDGTDCHTFNPSEFSNLELDHILESPSKLHVHPKKDKEFHNLFKKIPASEHLLADVSCALSKDILVHGKMYLSPNYICFNSNILGWVTNLVVPIQEIIQIEKKSTAVLFPNGMVIRTLHQKYVFATFLSRDTTFNMITQVWHNALQDNSADCFTKSRRSLSRRKPLSKKSTTKDLGNTDEMASAQSTKTSEDDQSLLHTSDANDITFLSKSSEKSKLKDMKRSTGVQDSSVLGTESDIDTDSIDGHKAPQPSLNDKTGESIFKGFPNPGPKRHSQTSFEHEKVDGEVEILQHTFNAPLGVVYNLLYGPDSSAFVKILEEGKNFDISKEKLTELDSQHKEREYSYTKPLSGPIGPKQTKCNITETLHHFDFASYCELEQVTKNLDVPLGNSFKVKTRFYFTWGPKNTTNLTVYTFVEWSAKSWIKLAVEKGSLDGQKSSMKVLTDTMTDVLRSGGSGTAKKKRRRNKSESQSARKAPEPSKQTPEPRSLYKQILEILDHIGQTIPIQIPMLNSTATGGVVLFFLSLLYSYILVSLMGGRSSGAPASKTVFLGNNKYVMMPSLEIYLNDEQFRKQNEAQLWNWISARTGEGNPDARHEKMYDEKYADENFKEIIRMTKKRIDVLCQGII
ncbi:hypothetical protein METBIDRAFT_44872 [Metschnikowia bicuspidata var. bicuspidata NRRL YB-4993]|uniref:VASt domain-containing protein n=1 Tax=Metschnikowia bicuspidata var. bicuspidata NRRL YB-4993 TaxID=869754 RepID=A0A1A0H7V5_9ASCO|nr:hypothetical protein METBIDRAFT_44872 [Metschnikowia bicuspidata var. bicuspidata NRRL YB-4993]OBA20106.1 hypothetical protein METBIDRAFT_44872 [Metschnikowia bicuspidata var. bicuspidata NRRL YB-4993]